MTEQHEKYPRKGGAVRNEGESEQREKLGAQADDDDNPTVNITTTEANSLIICVAAVQSTSVTSFTPDSGTIERVDVVDINNRISMFVGDRTEASIGTFAVGAVAVGDTTPEWAIVAVEILNAAVTDIPNKIVKVEQAINRASNY